MQAHDSDNDDNGDYFNPEEEVAIGDAKNCELPVNVVKSGEENEELIFKMRARLYRWRDNEWKHQLCYKDSMWSAFWSGVWNHLLKPSSI